LTALVRYQEEGDLRPGPGFFRLAARHGFIPEEEAPAIGEDSEWTGMTVSQETLWRGHLNAICAHFAE
jgi:hypothetical protein